MTRKLFVTAMSVLLLLGTTWSCKKEGGVDRGDINAAIKITVNDVTATSAVVDAVCAQENVTGCYYVSPVLTSGADLLNMDAIDRKAFIMENGQKMDMPFKDNVSKKLLAGTGYTVAVMGYDKDGVIRTAPWFTTFTTGKATVSTTAFLKSQESGYTFEYSILKGENTASVKYIVSTDKEITSLENDALKALIQKGGANVKTTSEDIPSATLTSAQKADFVVAAIAVDDMGREGEFASSLYSSETTVKLTGEGINAKLTAPVKDVEIFEGTVKMPKSSSFVININGIDFGFTDYSGNGGVGTVNNSKSAMPFYSMTDQMTYKFNVSKAIGQMSTIAEGGNKFWTNLAADADMFVRVDLTNVDGNARYYFEIPEKDDKVVFYEGFDLSVLGGFYQAPVAGTGCATSGEFADGTEPGTKGTISTTTNGIDSFTWPESAPRSANGWKFVISEKLIKNWGLDQWLFAGRSNLSAGHIRIQASSANNLSYAVTPKFTKLTAPTTVTVTIHAFCFAATLAGDFEIAVLGAGKITNSACTNTYGYNGKGGTFTDTVFTPEADLLPKEANNVVNKSIATIVLTVEGATADTQIRFGKDVALEAGNNGRVCIDDIKVTK